LLKGENDVTVRWFKFE